MLDFESYLWGPESGFLGIQPNVSSTEPRWPRFTVKTTINKKILNIKDYYHGWLFEVLKNSNAINGSESGVFTKGKILRRGLFQLSEPEMTRQSSQWEN